MEMTMHKPEANAPIRRVGTTIRQKQPPIKIRQKNTERKSYLQRSGLLAK